MGLKYLLFCLLILVGCDARRGHENVSREFRDSDIKTIPGEKYKFLVKDANGSIWFVKSTGESPFVKSNLMFK